MLPSTACCQGEENCFEGLTFVMTGVLESIERDDCKSLIERYGGKVTTNISRNTKYLIVGRDSGMSKIAKVIAFANIVAMMSSFSTPFVEFHNNSLSY